MSRRLRVGICAGAACILMTACGAPGGDGSSSLPPSPNAHHRPGAGRGIVKHIVLVIQENRSFNDLFAGFPGAVSSKTGMKLVQNGSGYREEPIQLREVGLLNEGDLSHVYRSYQTAYQSGNMDGFNLITYGTNGRAEGSAPYQYVNPSDIASYWDIASQWGLADEMFQTQGSGSFTAHQDLIRGGTFINATESLIDDPTSGEAWGCLSPKGARTSLIDTNLDYYRDTGPFPCTSNFPHPSDYPTLAGLFNAKSVSWKYYTPAPVQSLHNVGALWNAFLVIASVCNPQGQCSPHISSPETNIFSDISSGALPAMSWVIPDAKNSDHPAFSAEDDGPAWVASVVNAIGKSRYWNSTVIIVVWDDWGGFYDPVKPPFVDNQGGAGFRVPMLVVSPYVLVGNGSQGGYISNTVYGFGSIVRFIEGTFKVGRLGTTDITTKSISDMFNFKQQPRPFKEIPSNHTKEFFLHQKPSGLAIDTE